MWIRDKITNKVEFANKNMGGVGDCALILEMQG